MTEGAHKKKNLFINSVHGKILVREIIGQLKLIFHFYLQNLPLEIALVAFLCVQSGRTVEMRLLSKEKPCLVLIGVAKAI